MSKFRYLTTTLDFTTGIYGPSFPAQEGLSLHSYTTEKPFYTVTTRKHGTTAFAWQTNGAKQTDRDTIEDFWYTTLTEGYDNFTIIDHRKRMLFEASWNDWIERWTKRNGGVYDITYQIESPIPWTLSTFGIYPMVTAALINHNLSGDNLTASNGSYVQNSVDASVLRLNGYALKMEGDGSSSGLLGATGVVEWARTTKHNHITLFCQFMADAVLQTGNLGILEVAHSSNVFRIGLKSSQAVGVLTYVETVDTGISFTDCILDIEKKIGFASSATPNHLRTYLYDTDGDFTFVEGSGQAYTAYQMALDTTLTPRIIFTAVQNTGITVHSYNDTANLTHIQNKATTFAKGVVLDVGRGIVFVGEAHVGGPSLESYPYTGAGIGAQIDATPNDTYSCTRLEIDTEYRLIFLVSGNTTPTFAGLLSWSYDENGDNLTYKYTANSFDRDVNHAGCAVDTIRKLIFDCSNSGLYVYNYNLNGEFSSSLSSVTGKVFINASIDTTNKLIYAVAKGDGLFVYRYSEYGTTLTQVDFNDKTGDYYDCAFDNINSVGMVTTKLTTGIYTYKIGEDANYLFGKIVNNADSAEVRKGAATYHELTAGTWYDLAFTYDAITQKSFLYFAESGDSSFTEFLSGETDITEGIGSTNNQDCTVQDIPWTACNILKELTSDVVGDGNNVYVQNPMVFDGTLSPHDFNTLRRLTFLWNKKTDTYPK